MLPNQSGLCIPMTSANTGLVLGLGQSRSVRLVRGPPNKQTNGPPRKHRVQCIQPGQRHRSLVSSQAAAIEGGGSADIASTSTTAHPASSSYQLSDDPFLRRSQLLLQASRRLRGEEPLPHLTPGVGGTVGGVAFTRLGISLDTATPGGRYQGTATAARLTATASGPAVAAAGATAAAAQGLIGPAAASASPAVAAAPAAVSAAASGWMAIEQLLGEAAYSLSQQVPDVGLPSPLVQGLAKGLPRGLPGADKLNELLDNLLYSLAGDLDLNLAAAGQAAAGGAMAAAAGLAGAAAELPRAAAQVYRSAAEAAAASRAMSAAGVQGGRKDDGAQLTFIEEEPLPEDTGAGGAVRQGAGLGDPAAAAGGAGGEGDSLQYNPSWDPYGTIRAADADQQQRQQQQEGAGAAVEGTAPELNESPAMPYMDEANEYDEYGDELYDNLDDAAFAYDDDVTAAVLGTAGGGADATTADALAAAADSTTSSFPVVTAAAGAPSVADAAIATTAATVQAATTAAAGSIVIPSPPVPPLPPPPPALVAGQVCYPVPNAADAVPAAAAAAPATPALAPLPGALPDVVPGGPALVAPPPAVPNVAPLASTSGGGIGSGVAAAAVDGAEAEGAQVVAAATVPEPSEPEPEPEPELSPEQPGGSAAAVALEEVEEAGGAEDGYGYEAYNPYGGEGAAYGMEDSPSDELTSALQDLLAVPPDAAAATASAAAAASSAGGSAPSLPADAEVALSQLSEALRRELTAVVGPDVDTADPSSLADAAGRAVGSALSSLDLPVLSALGQLPPDVRLSSLLGAVLQSALDLVDSALGGVRAADSELVGGVAIAAVLALALRSLVSLAGNALGGSGGGAGETGNGVGGSLDGGRTARPVGMSSLEAAAALNNNPRALLLDIRNGSDVSEQGLPDLRPFCRGAGAASAALPYCDFRTAPTLANPSGIVGGPPMAVPPSPPGRWGLPSAFPSPAPPSSSSASASSSAALSTRLLGPAPGSVTAAVDPLFSARFKALPGLSRDSRVLLLDSYGVEAPEAVLLLRSDPNIERLLGAQGLTFIEGGFAGPDGWKLTGLPVADLPEDPKPSAAAPGFASSARRGGRVGLLDMGGLAGGLAGLRVRYPSLFGRVLAVGALGGAGAVAASSVDWGAAARGGVALAALLLAADRALPTGVRPSARVRRQLQTQLAAVEAGQAPDTNRRRTQLILRALDLVEAVGDAVVRVGGAAVSAAKTATSGGSANAEVGVIGGSLANGNGASAAAVTATEGATETPAPLSSSLSASASSNTVVLPHGMDSQQWSDDTSIAGAAATAAPPRTAANWRAVVDPAPTTTAAKPAAAGASDGGSPPRSASPSLAGRLGDALRGAASAVVRAASPMRGTAAPAAFSSTPSLSYPSACASRSSSPSRSGQPADTLDLMAALAAASAMNGASLLPGLPPVSFPKASAGQVQAQEGPKAAEEQAAADGSWWEEAEAVEEEKEVGAGSSDWGTASGADAAVERALAAIEAALGGSGASDGGSNGDGAPVTPHVSVAVPLAARSPRWEEAEAQVRKQGEAAAGALPGSVPIPRAPANWRDAAVADAAASSTAMTNGGGSISTDSDSASRRKQPLRTASPERAAATAAAMRRLRAAVGDADDDGVSVGVLGGDGFWGVGSSGEYEEEREREDQQAGAEARQAAVVTGGAKGVAADSASGRAGSAAVAAARLARSRGGLSPGTGSREGLELQPHHQAQVTAADRGRGKAGRRRTLRTASPERAAAAAAAMRQLRLEAGLPPNDGETPVPAASATSSSGSRIAAAVRHGVRVTAYTPSVSPSASSVVPRDWRRELERAAGEEAAADASAGVGATNVIGGAASRRAATGSASRLAAATRSPSNWRDQVEANGHAGDNGHASPSSAAAAAPADWRSRIEGSSSPRRGASPAKLSLGERAQRDLRLRDWRARV